MVKIRTYKILSDIIKTMENNPYMTKNLYQKKYFKKLNKPFFHCCAEPTTHMVSFKVGKTKKTVGLCEYHYNNPNPSKYALDNQIRSYSTKDTERSGLDAFL
jgi:hypothetical protein